jgi:hypothetical protein
MINMTNLHTHNAHALAVILLIYFGNSLLPVADPIELIIV